MIITKMALPRRTFLRGMGATLALPLLDAMVPAFSATVKTAASPVRRLGFIFMANGANMNLWKPKGDGRSLELSPTLSPLAPFQNQVTVLTGLAHRQALALGDGNGEHARSSAVWLNGVHPKWTEGADVEAGITVDQLAAQELGKATPLPSLEISLEPNFLVGNCENGYSCVYLNTISWRNPTTPNPMENNPRVVFEQLFGDGGTAAQRLRQMRRTRSILDWVTEDVARLQRTLGAGDRTRVNEYLDGVREVERRIQKAEHQSTTSVLPVVLERPVGVPDTYDEHARVMFDLVALAYQADVTRVFTYMLCREQNNTTYPHIGVPDAHHSVSHHANDPEKLEKYARINKYHVELFAYLLDRLQSMPDGDGSVLDHSMLLYGGGISDGDLHSHFDLPTVLVGGGTGRLKGGRLLQYSEEPPLNNLLVSLLDKVGVHTDAFGDSTGRIELEPLSDV